MMNDYEKPMTLDYWKQVGGTLILEYPIAGRLIDGVIVPDGERRIALPTEVSLMGRDVILVETKARPLGRNVLSQARYGVKLVKADCAPRSVRAVVLVTGDDGRLRPFADEDGIEVVVDDAARLGVVARRAERRAKRRAARKLAPATKVSVFENVVMAHLFRKSGFPGWTAQTAAPTSTRSP
jgi:hypothetical protein